MDYPFRYDSGKVGDKVWFVTTQGPVEAIIIDKHDNYYNRLPNLSNKEDYSIDYWIDIYDHHALMFGSDLFWTEEEALDEFNR